MFHAAHSNHDAVQFLRTYSKSCSIHTVWTDSANLFFPWQKSRTSLLHRERKPIFFICRYKWLIFLLKKSQAQNSTLVLARALTNAKQIALAKWETCWGACIPNRHELQRLVNRISRAKSTFTVINKSKMSGGAWGKLTALPVWFAFTNNKCN